MDRTVSAPAPAGLVVAAGSGLRLDDLVHVVALIPDTLMIIGWCANLSQTTRSWLENKLSLKCLDLKAISENIDESVCAKATSAVDVFGSQEDSKLKALILEKLYSEAEEITLATEMVKLVTSKLDAKDGKVYFLGKDRIVSNAVKAELEHPSYLEILEPLPNASRDIKSRVSVYIKGLHLEGRISDGVSELIERTDIDWRFRTSLPGRSFWVAKNKKYLSANGEICLFSSYANNSRSILNLRSLFPQDAHWIVANLSARRVLPKSARWSWLWAYANMSQIRSWSQPLSSAVLKSDCKENMELENLWPDNSKTLSSWEAYESMQTARMIACWDNYLEEHCPRLVVVSNQWSAEGVLALRAKEMGIPVLQVFHGVTGSHLYREHEVIGDCMVVPGKYWADTLSVNSRHKALVVGSTPDITYTTSDVPHRLTFFSTSISDRSHIVAEDEYKAMVNAICYVRNVSGWSVVMRPHPVENPAHFLDYWRSATTDEPPIILSAHKETLYDAIKSTGVALTSPSSILLACAASGVRATLPGWIPFSWRDGVESVSNGKLAAFASEPDEMGKILEAQIIDAEHFGPLDSRDSDFRARFGVGHEELREWISETTGKSNSNYSR
ncbi:MAG: hypothetical protein HKL80_07365 [Acidimicrobiales bacterium]|nr:hypothetical protein [Acidimicrobiales bacterium]